MRGTVLLLSVVSLFATIVMLRPDVSRSRTNATSDFQNFESLPVHPLDITPDGTRLLALNIPDARLEVFAIGAKTLVSLGEVSVGLEPVTVRAQNDSTAWVVNQLSDDVSVVDLRTMRVRATLRVGDQPTDVVFAGKPARAFVCVSGEDAVKAYDPSTLEAAFPATPILGRHPRSLAVGSGGKQVYVTVLDAGNRTSVISASRVAAFGGPSPPNPKMDPTLPPAPEVGLIVQWNGAHWVDDGLPTPKIWDAAFPPGFSPPDAGVAVLSATSGAITSTISGVGTNNFNIAVDPKSGALYVTNTEARNLTRFEPNLRGRFLENRVTRIGADGAVSARDLGLAEPMDLVVNGARGKVYVAALGSSRVGVLDLAGNVTNRIPTSGGPVGLALDVPRHQLFVLSRFTNSIAIMDTRTETKVGETALRFDPTPPEVRDGRAFLYDGSRSAHGDLACASCHIGGNQDGLAWDLGDPRGAMEPSLILHGRRVHPMKGPMATTSLRGLADTSPLHWRADRMDFTRINSTFVEVLGAPDTLSTEDMKAFDDFILTLAYPPNPNQTLSRGFTALADSGRVEFESRPHEAGQTCAFCHSLPAGTNRLIMPSVLIQESQDFKTAQLRGLYEKKGFLHDGSVDNLVDFLRRPIFEFPDTMGRYELQAFLLSFDTGTAPSVGREVTVNGANKNQPGITSLLDSLYAQAELKNCDLVAHGRIGGVMKGFWYQPGGTFLSDYDPEGSIPADALRSWATNGGEITYLGVPPGSGRRVGIDRDRDGYRDRWEFAMRSNPADVLSVPTVTGWNGRGRPRRERTLLLSSDRRNHVSSESLVGSRPLVGAWLWSWSDGGMVPGHNASPPGCSLLVYVHRDRTYACWERDSQGDNLLFRGKYKIHTERGWPQSPPAIAVEFMGGWFDGRDQLVWFEGTDEFKTYPGGRKFSSGVVQSSPTDMLTTHFVRVQRDEPRITPTSTRLEGKMRHPPVWVAEEAEMLKAQDRRPRSPVRSDSAR